MSVVRYLVSDLDKALAFYTDALAFTLIDRWGDDFARVERAGLTLWLSGPRTSAARPLVDGSQPVPGGWNRIVLVVSDLDDAIARLNQAHVKYRGEVVSGPGGKQILVEDSDGNVVEIFQSAS